MKGKEASVLDNPGIQWRVRAIFQATLHDRVRCCGQRQYNPRVGDDYHGSYLVHLYSSCRQPLALSLSMPCFLLLEVVDIRRTFLPKAIAAMSSPLCSLALNEMENTRKNIEVRIAMSANVPRMVWSRVRHGALIEASYSGRIRLYISFGLYEGEVRHGRVGLSRTWTIARSGRRFQTDRPTHCYV